MRRQLIDALIVRVDVFIWVELIPCQNSIPGRVRPPRLTTVEVVYCMTVHIPDILLQYCRPILPPRNQCLVIWVILLSMDIRWRYSYQTECHIPVRMTQHTPVK